MIIHPFPPQANLSKDEKYVCVWKNQLNPDTRERVDHALVVKMRLNGVHLICAVPHMSHQ